MAASLWQSGAHLDYTPTVATSAGTVVALGSDANPLLGVAANDIEKDQLGSLTIAGVFHMDNSGIQPAVGDEVAYHIANGNAVAAAAAGVAYTAGTVVYPVTSTTDKIAVLLNNRGI